MKITVKKLEELGACSDGIDSFRASFPDGGEFRDVVERAIEIGEDALIYALWLAQRVLTKEDAVRYAIFAAREVLPIFEIKYPNDNRPRKAIESAEAWLANPCEETMNAAASAASAAEYAAEYAAEAAFAAAFVAAFVDAASAASAAEYAASAAEYAAEAAFVDAASAAASAAESAAEYAAEYAAEAAFADSSTRDELKIKHLRYAVDLVEITEKE